MAAGDDVSEALLLVSFKNPPTTDLSGIALLVSHKWVQPPPWTLVGSQSNADAVRDLAASGDAGPYESNRDADRGLKT
jgi:hypothetical protein